MRPAGGPWDTRRRPTGHRRASELRIMRAAFVCPTLRGPLPLLGNGLGLGHGHGHEHGWLAGWEAIPPPSHGRQQRRAVRGPRRKCSASILSFLSSCLAKGTPPRPLSPQQGGGGICCSRAPVCACHHTSQYLHAARCGMCVRFGEFMYVRRAGTRMDGAASSRMTKGDPNSCSRTPRNTGRWPEQEAPTWYFRQLSEKRQGCILRLYSLCRGAVFLLAFPWPALARLETPS